MSRVANLFFVPFSKSKPGRSPLQRLSDSRRSVALGGLALGVVFSAGFFRRKRRAGEIEFERPASVPVPSSPVDSGPPPAVVVPSPASEPSATGPIAAVATDALADEPSNGAATPINATT